MRPLTPFQSIQRRLLFLLFFLAPACTVERSACNLEFSYTPPAYYGYGEYRATCPDHARIRCYHYHWDWICEKGSTLYWDRRLEAAAHAACGCPLPPGIAPASPATSGRPAEEIFP